MEIKKRNPILVGIWGILTFGIYFIYWTIKTRSEINSIGGKIVNIGFYLFPLFCNLIFLNNPSSQASAILIISSISSLYFWISYTRNFTKYILNTDSKMVTLYWVLFIFFFPVITLGIFAILTFAVIYILGYKGILLDLINRLIINFEIGHIPNDLFFLIIAILIIFISSLFIAFLPRILIQSKLNEIFKNNRDYSELNNPT